MSNLTLVIPAKSEALSLPNVLQELERYNYNTFVVLEETDTETINAIKDCNCEIIFQKGKGYGDALIEGIKKVETKYFCIFNADGSFNPTEIEKMIERLESENLDILFASRYQKLSGSEDDTIVTLIGNYFFSLIGKIFFKLNISDILYTFVLGKTESALSLNLIRKDFTFCVELPIKSKKSNLKISSIGSYERERIAGKKKVNALKDGFLILKYLVYLFFNLKLKK
jgi:glycosyltransferase involved in cell wall biosynthesis